MQSVYVITWPHDHNYKGQPEAAAGMDAGVHVSSSRPLGLISSPCPTMLHAAPWP